jgi:hypothetical protein
MEEHSLEHRSPLLVADIIEGENDKSATQVQTGSCDAQVEGTLTLACSRSNRTLLNIPATLLLGFQDGVERTAGLAKLRRSAPTVTLRPMDAVEGLANPQPENLVLPPIKEAAEPLVGRHSLAIFIQDDRRRRKGVQEFSKMGNGRYVAVFSSYLFNFLLFQGRQNAGGGI